MYEAKRWTVTIDIDEHDGRTRAVARLQARDTDSLVGVGLARLNPADRNVPEIGDELADPLLRDAGALGQYAITEAFRHTPAAVVAPLEYTALAWGLGLDWLLWQTRPDRTMLLGAGVIILAGLYLLRRERVHAEAEHP